MSTLYDARCRTKVARCGHSAVVKGLHGVGVVVCIGWHGAISASTLREEEALWHRRTTKEKARAAEGVRGRGPSGTK